VTTFTILAVLRVGLGLLAAFIGRVKHVLRSDRLLPRKGLRDVFAIFGPVAVCASILLMEPPASAQQVRLDPTNDLITSFYKDPPVTARSITFRSSRMLPGQS
jgi:hypothetical protein